MAQSSSKSFTDMLNFSRKPPKLKISVYVSEVDAENGGVAPDPSVPSRIIAGFDPPEKTETEQNEDDSMKYTFEPNNSTDEFAIELRRKVEKCLADCNQSNAKEFLLDIKLLADSSWAQSTRGTAWEHLAPVWSTIQGSGVGGVRYLDIGDSKLPIMAWAPQLERLSRSLTVLDISGLGLMSFPPEVASLSLLQSLHVHRNKLAKMPENIGKLSRLKLLQIDHNLLETIPQNGLSGLSELEHLSMECNKLSHLLANFSDTPKLRTLLLAGNPLKRLPDFTCLENLRCFTVANVRIESRADPGASLDLSHISIGLGEDRSSLESSSSSSFILAPFSRAASPRSRWTVFIETIFRTPACQHPLIAAAIAWVAKEPSYAEAISNDKNALQQLQGMILAENGFVVRCATSTLASLASVNSRVAYGFIDDSGRHPIRRLLKAKNSTEQLSGLHLLASLALTSEEIALPLAYPPILNCLMSLIEDAKDLAVKRHALLALGNLAFYISIRKSLLNDSTVRKLITKVANANAPQHEGDSPRKVLSTPLAEDPVRLAAIRLLGILGLNDELASALREEYPTNPTEPSKSGHGVRILCLDGGGMRGFLTVKLLMELERRLGRPIHQCFDLIVGTSTGGILAATIGIKRQSLEFALNLYRKLGKKIFELRPSNDPENDDDKSSDEDAAADNQADQAGSSSGPSKPRNSSSYWHPGIDINALYGKTSLGIFLRGSKYNSTRFEEMIMNMSETANGPQTEALNRHAKNEGQWDPDYDRLIDHCVLGSPKTAIVATRVSVTPVQPYLFRTYQCPPETPDPTETGLSPGNECRPTSLCCAYPGSSRNALWEAVRASSAAPYYFEEFQVGDDRWADGAVVANNPSMIAMREARVIWPDVPISALVSVGSGSFPFKPREKSGHWFIDMGAELMESATNFHLIGGALETLMPLIPGLQYFRLCPSDPRCDVELDDTSEEAMEALDAAATEFIEANKEQFAALVDVLLPSCDQKEQSSSASEDPNGSRENSYCLSPRPSTKSQAATTLTTAQPQLPVRVVIAESYPTVKTLMESFRKEVSSVDRSMIKDQSFQTINYFQRSINRSRFERRVDIFKVSSEKKLDHGGNYEILHLALDWSPEDFVTSFKLPADDVAIVEGSEEWLTLVGDQQEIGKSSIAWGKNHAFVFLASMRHQGIEKDITVRVCKRVEFTSSRLRDGNVNALLSQLGLAHCKFEIVTLAAAISQDLAEQLLGALGSKAVVYPENVQTSLDPSENVRIAIGEQLSSFCQQVHIEKKSVESALQKLNTKDNIITWKAVQASD